MTSKKVGVGFFMIFMLVSLLFPVGCGKKEVKPAPQESKTTQEAFELAEAIKKAYEEKDKSSLEENTTADGYRELISAIKSFDRAELAFTPTWVEIKDSSVSLNISWKGAWTVRGTVTNESGLAVFVLEGSPLKLSKILRENPFRQPE
ncbi:MAG: hypothetical protein RDU01_05045 [Thermodesulfovibrionales bacterium]|nr:hypothetical protein [Thermodesulfovibrionales bacterium]